MAANKVVLNDEVLIDLTNDTVTEDDVKKGVVFHKPDGTQAVGVGGVELDTTLTQEGKAADAKAVGDRFGAYVDDVDALLGNGTGTGGGSSGGMSVKSITFTDRPTAWEWLCNNYYKVTKTFITASVIPKPIVFETCSPYLDPNTGEVMSMYFATFLPLNVEAKNYIAATYYARITDTKIQLQVAGNHLLSFADYTETGGGDLIGITGEDPTDLPDEYWSQMGAQLTCYYIE